MSQSTIPSYFKGKKRPSSGKRPSAGESYAKQHSTVESVAGGVDVRVDIDGDGKHDVEISPIMRESFEMEDEPAVPAVQRSVASRTVSVPSNVVSGNMTIRRRRSIYRRPYTVYARPRGYFRARTYRTKFLRRPKA